MFSVYIVYLAIYDSVVYVVCVVICDYDLVQSYESSSASIPAFAAAQSDTPDPVSLVRARVGHRGSSCPFFSTLKPRVE